MRSIRLRYDYDTTRLATKNWHVHFLLASNRVEWKQARAMRRSRIVVESQLQSRHKNIFLYTVPSTSIIRYHCGVLWFWRRINILLRYKSKLTEPNCYICLQHRWLQRTMDNLLRIFLFTEWLVLLSVWSAGAHDAALVDVNHLPLARSRRE